MSNVPVETVLRIIYAYDDGSYFSHLLEPDRDYEPDDPPRLGALLVDSVTHRFPTDHPLYGFVETFAQSDIGRMIGAVCGPIGGVRIVSVEYPIVDERSH